MIVNEEPQKLERNVSTELLTCPHPRVTFFFVCSRYVHLFQALKWLLEYKMSLSIFSQILTNSHFTNNCKIEIIAVLQGKEKYV